MSSSFAFMNDKKESSNLSSSFNFIPQSPKKEFKSSFHESEHGALKKSRPKFNFSSSFIMEELSGDNNSLVRRESPKKSTAKSYFSFIDDLEKTHKTWQHKKSTNSGNNQKPSVSSSRQAMSQSVFQFMNQDNDTTNNSLLIYDNDFQSDEKSVSSSNLSRSTIKQDNEVKYLQVQSTWNNIQEKKANDLRWIEGLYLKQAMIMDKIQSIKEDLSTAQKEQEDAVASEDFQLAQQHAQQIELLKKNMNYLMYDQLDALTKEVRTKWQRMIDLLGKEASSAEAVIQYGELVREERYQKLNQFVSDINLIRNSKIQGIEERRQGLESAKSEIAFDHDMWHQNEADLNERKEDTIHDELRKKKELSVNSEKIKNEIEELRAKLKALEAEDKTVEKEMQAVDLVIKEKLQPFMKEEEELRQEREIIHNRQVGIEEESEMLDREYEDIQRDIRKQDDKRTQDEQELKGLDVQIESAIQREKLNQAEMLQSQQTLQRIVQDRDLIVSQHQEQMKAVQEKIKLKSNEIKAISQSLYHQENACINLEDFITNITNKLARLTKLKQLAIQNHEFENASQLSKDINAAKVSLDEAKSKKEAHINLGSMKAQVAQEKSSLNQLQQEFNNLQKQSGINMEIALEKIKNDLIAIKEKAKDFNSLNALITLEIKSIELQLK